MVISLQIIPKTEVVALCDIDQESLAREGKSFNWKTVNYFTSFDDFINADFDIAVLGSPIPDHATRL